MNIKPSMVFVDAARRLTADAFAALQASRDPFQVLPLPTGPISSNVDVTYRPDKAGHLLLQTNGVVVGAVTLTRGATTLNTGGGIPVPVSPGDIFKFTYTVFATPKPVVYFLPR